MTDLPLGSSLPPVPPIADSLTTTEAHSPTPLSLQAQTLADEVIGLRKAADALSTRTTRHGWALALTTVGLVIDVGLSIFAFVILHTQSATAAQLQTQQHQIISQQAQTENTRRIVLCPLFTVFLAGDTPQARAAYPQGVTAYDHAVTVIKTGATQLKCG